MYTRVDEFFRPGEMSRRLAPKAIADCYRGIELAPTTLESLATWDVSGHAQRERERLHDACRLP
jgi:hypothetical protein